MLRIFHWLPVWIVLAIAITSGSLSAADDAPAAGARILFLTYSGGFRHGSVFRKDSPLAGRTGHDQLGHFQQLVPGRLHARSGHGINEGKPAELPDRDVLHDRTRAKWPVTDEAFDYFLNDWLKQPGHGFIGAHSAADTLGDYKPYWDMIGGTFNGHPWGSGDTVTIAVHDQQHPVSKPWGSEFTIKDEIYRFKNWQPEKGARVDEPRHGEDGQEGRLSCACGLG